MAPAGPLEVLLENVELCTFIVPRALTAPPAEMVGSASEVPVVAFAVTRQ